MKGGEAEGLSVLGNGTDCLTLQAEAGIKPHVLKATLRVLSLDKSTSSQKAQILTTVLSLGLKRWQSCWWATLTPPPPLCHQRVPDFIHGSAAPTNPFSQGHSCDTALANEVSDKALNRATGPVLMGD